MSNTSLNFDLLKLIKQNTKDVVFGYMRKMASLVQVSSNIPKLVKFTVLYYYHQPEYFTVYSPKIALDEFNSIITNNKISNKNHTSYGNIDVNGSVNAVFVWKILLICGFGTVCIGLDSSNKKYINGDFSDRKQNQFNFYAFSDQNKYNHRFIHAKYGDDWCDQDILTMELNTKEKTLKLYINDIDQGVGFNNIELKDKNYNFAIALYHSNESIQLLSFEQTIIE
eukprot:223217_1